MKTKKELRKFYTWLKRNYKKQKAKNEETKYFIVDDFYIYFVNNYFLIRINLEDFSLEKFKEVVKEKNKEMNLPDNYFINDEVDISKTKEVFLSIVDRHFGINKSYQGGDTVYFDKTGDDTFNSEHISKKKELNKILDIFGCSISDSKVFAGKNKWNDITHFVKIKNKAIEIVYVRTWEK